MDIGIRANAPEALKAFAPFTAKICVYALRFTRYSPCSYRHARNVNRTFNTCVRPDIAHNAMQHTPAALVAHATLHRCLVDQYFQSIVQESYPRPLAVPLSNEVFHPAHSDSKGWRRYFQEKSAYNWRTEAYKNQAE